MRFCSEIPIFTGGVRGGYFLVWMTEYRCEHWVRLKLYFGSLKGRVCDHGDVDLVEVVESCVWCFDVSVGFRCIRGCNFGGLDDCLRIRKSGNEVFYAFSNNAIAHSLRPPVGICCHELI